MKRFIFCVSLVLTGLMTACIDKNEAVDADSKPSWLGGSIYQELKNPTNLTGTFNTYLRLIDDLGYSETLNRTGSMTVFPANDEAFERFFASNDWGVRRYEDLTTAQRNLLLKNSMLSNALLVGMLSNASAGTDAVSKGMSMKHQTSQNVIDTIQHIMPAEMPQNNVNWDAFRTNSNMFVVSDATRPMMVHFTREHMLNNGITTLGAESDFAILTGTEYKDGMAYIFGDQVVKSDVTCQNGYIHQMQDVIVPPGNMAQALRSDNETSLFSRLVDFYSAPFENAEVTKAYNSWAEEQAKVGNPVSTIGQIYEIRYLNNDANHRQNRDANNQMVDNLLKFDPGWNQYSPLASANGVELNMGDVAAIFAPTNKALADFFVHGDGAYLIDLYGKHTGSNNTEANLTENLDSLYKKQPGIVTDFINNLMRKEFTNSVPSKFEKVTNDANEFMGLTLNMVQQKADGKYDIKVANNGVIYKMNTLIAPDKYQSVMAPATVYPDMRVMRWAINDDDQLGVSFHYYLMAMKANYAFFIPDDEAFENFYIDPIYLGHSQPRALKFYYEATSASSGTVKCTAYEYDPNTNTIGNVLNSGNPIATNQWKSLFVDILNYHTVVLDSTEVFGANRYYKTKHGGAIRVDGISQGGKVLSGQQIDNGVVASKIENVYKEKNGTAFRVNHVIESPRNSVSRTLRNYPDKFSEFYQLCSGFSVKEILTWAGISDAANEFGISEQDAYTIFTADRRVSKTEVLSSSCLDENVKMFNTYNYTLYAPNNDAMKKAYNSGLPSWNQVQKLYEDYADADEEVAAPYKAKAKAMIDQMRDFARYHFQSVSVYADNNVEARTYNSLSTTSQGIAYELKVLGNSGSGKLYVQDGAGNTRVIDANDSSKKCNLMARDYWFDKTRTQASSIYTSSFCVIHELSEPLYAK